jgi:hypothetical protein
MAMIHSHATTQPADAALDEFIFHPDQFRMFDVPRNLRPFDVAAFIQANVDKQTPLKALIQTEKVVDYYDLYEACDHLLSLLDRREVNNDERLRSCVLTRAVAKGGNPTQREAAKQYYLFLVSRSDTLELLEALVGVYEALDGAGDIKPLREKLETRRKALEPHRDAEDQRKHEYKAAERLVEHALPRAEQSNAAKAKILALKSRKSRIDELVRIYLGLTPGYPEYMPGWSARRLRREVWGEHPPDQVVRSSDPTRRAELVESFRRALEAIDIHAIEFFGGELSAEEQVLLDTKGGTHVDVLAIR